VNIFFFVCFADAVVHQQHALATTVTPIVVANDTENKERIFHFGYLFSHNTSDKDDDDDVDEGKNSVCK
jgi:hypothetical protein